MLILRPDREDILVRPTIITGDALSEELPATRLPEKLSETNALGIRRLFIGRTSRVCLTTRDRVPDIIPDTIRPRLLHDHTIRIDRTIRTIPIRTIRCRRIRRRPRDSRRRLNSGRDSFITVCHYL